MGGTTYKSLVCLFLVGCGIRPAYGSQVGTAEKPKSNDIVELINAYSMLGINDKNEQERELKSALGKYIIRRMSNENDKEERTRAIVSWTNFCTYITFGIAHVLLICGFLLAYSEIKRSWRLRKRGKEVPLEVELGVEKIALKGALNGFFYMSACLLFYFLYLKFVYPVTIV